MHIILIKIATLISATIPLGLIAINIFRKIFFRENPAIAGVTTVCTTVIGTLTKENISIRTVLFDNYELTTEEQSGLIHLENIETKEILKSEKKQLQKEQSLKLMATITTLCHYHKIHEIEAIIAKFFKVCAIDSQQIIADYETLSSIPSSEEKKISTVVAIKKETKEIFAFVKGNPKKVLEKCSRIIINGKKIDIDQNLRKKLIKRIEKLNKRGEKVISFAYKPLPFKRLDHYSEHFTENDLVLIGFIGLGNETNPELIPYIEEIKKHGIKIYVLASAKERLVTAIAHQLKIINPHYFESLTGKDLDDLNEQKLRKMLLNKEKDYIFSELKRSDREKIIKSLKQNEETVIFINKNSKIQIKDVMNQIGHQQQHIKNQKKLIYHALSCKTAEIILLISALIFKAPLPLSIILITTIDLLINSLLELSLYRTPLNEQSNKVNYTHLIANGTISGLILSSLYLWSLIRFGWYPGENLTPEALSKSITIVFIALIIIQIFSAFNLYNTRQSILKIKLKSILYLILTAIISLMIIYIFTNFKFFQENLKLTTLLITEWEIIIFIGIITVMVEEVRKYLIRKNEISENQSNSQKP